MNSWPSVEDIVDAAFRAGSRAELRHWLLERLVAAAGSTGGAFIDVQGGPSETLHVSQALLARLRERLVHAQRHIAEPDRGTHGGTGTRRPKLRRERGKHMDRRRIVALTSEGPFADTSLAGESKQSVLYGELNGPKESGRRWLCLYSGGRSFALETLERLEALLPAIALADTAYEGPSSSAARVSSAELTDRQRQICEHVALGFSNQEIAHACGLREPTVRNYLVQLCHRFSVRTRTELMARMTHMHVQPDAVGRLTLQARAAVTSKPETEER